MALIVGGSIAITITVAAREYESPEAQRRPNIAIKPPRCWARAACRRSRSWLTATRTRSRPRLYIIGPDGKDILGRRSRRWPRAAWSSSIARQRRPRRQWRPEPRPPGPPPPGNFRPLRAPRRRSSARRLRLHRAVGAAPPQHFRRAERARDLLTILGIALPVSASPAGGWRSTSRADSPHPRRRARARLENPNAREPIA
jgi:hypothetical protein